MSNSADKFQSLLSYFREETSQDITDFVISSVNGKFKFCLVAGSSGSGKTMLVQLLAEHYPEHFNILRQVTTRDMREGEENSSYFFLSHDEYDIVYNNLVARNLNFYNNNYGTLFTPHPDKINLIVVNDNGTRDFIEDNARYGFADTFILGLDRDIESASTTEGRSHREIDTERRVLDFADYIYEFKGTDYLDIVQAKKILDEHFKTIFEG
jgi:energy-coupling factor transporter ATP-binding protein EcfA2